jgi:hypothetical protein
MSRETKTNNEPQVEAIGSSTREPQAELIGWPTSEEGPVTRVEVYGRPHDLSVVIEVAETALNTLALKVTGRTLSVEAGTGAKRETNAGGGLGQKFAIQFPRNIATERLHISYQNSSIVVIGPKADLKESESDPVEYIEAAADYLFERIDPLIDALAEAQTPSAVVDATGLTLEDLDAFCNEAQDELSDEDRTLLSALITSSERKRAALRLNMPTGAVY